MALLSLDDAQNYTSGALGGNAYAAAARLPGEVANIAPLATNYSVQQAPMPIAQNQLSTGSGLFHFLGGVAHEVGHITASAADWLAKNTVQMVEAPLKFADSTYHFGVDYLHSQAQGRQSDQLFQQQKNLSNQWKSGRISTSQYQAGLKDILKAQNDLSQQMKDTGTKLQLEGGVSQKAGLDTVATLLTLATAGFGAPEITASEKAASVFLLSKEADPALMDAASGIAKLASDSKAFSALSDGTQAAIQRATAEVIANQPVRMTAGQIAKATAVNLALKYPVYFNMLSSTGQQIYKELDNKKYGDAVRTIAFNALLFLSGGPIGHALKYGGKAVGGATAATFGQSSFWDELSKFYGNGNTQGFYKAVNTLTKGMAPEERQAFIKNLSAVEATNLNAVGGDAVAAAKRVASGMSDIYGFDMSQVTHQEGLQDMAKFAKWQQIASDTAKANGLGDVTVGRVDVRDLNNIAAKVAAAPDEASRLQVWNDLKGSNPNQAWANNSNFDKQITSIIGREKNTAELHNAISNIKAQFAVRGFPEKVAKQMAKDGYFPIKPVDPQAPFKEGTGAVASKFAQTGDLWTKAVQPLPILSSVGAALTKLGLSPYASTQRVYQVFNASLAKNLEETGIAQKIVGENLNQTTDSMIKKLSSYAHEPPAGRVFARPPIMDLRQLSKTDIEKALGVSRVDATQIQKAIAKSMLEVPVAIRGLGERAVDVSYPALRKFLRLQGIARFTYNPFFQYLRLIPKTEILTESEGGGFFRSLFAGRLGEISQIRTALREAKAFDKTAGFGATGGSEAVDQLGQGVGYNLTKKLLPMQERSIAGLVDAQANRMGMDWREYIKAYPDQVRDTVQAIAQYDRHAQFLNSPLLRTLNIAFFPLRFETKVATIMAKGLARTSLLTQVSVIKGLLSAHDWLQSPEGQAWYQQNADAIGVFKYISPVATMSEVMSSLLPGHDHSLGNFGELGGLPFGWIPQILDAEGLTQFNQPGVNPKTGQEFPKYIPVTTKGQAAIAIQDFLGTLFSYPGATAGLPSKSSITRAAALDVTGAKKKTDLKITNLPPTPGLGTPTPVAQNTTVPQGSSPLTIPPSTPPSSSKSSKKKKSQFTPELLPGQTTLGQL